MDLFGFEDVAANYDNYVTALGSDTEAVHDGGGRFRCLDRRRR